MKKFLTTFLLSLLFVFGTASAQFDEGDDLDGLFEDLGEELGEGEDLFESAPEQIYHSDFQVYNVSQGNADATEVGAQPGDILLYELELMGTDSGDALGPRININSIASLVTIENMNNAQLQGESLVYPDISEVATDWSRKHGFYVKLKDTVLGQPSIQVAFAEDTLIVPINGYDEEAEVDLAATGPNSIWLLFTGVVFFLLGVFYLLKRKV